MATKPRHGRKTCRDCDRRPSECGPLSQMGGLCSACQIDRMTKSAKQLSDKAGPYYEQWKQGMAELVRRLEAAG